MKKKLVVIYFHTEDGAEITLSDYEQFYLELRETQAFKDAEIEIEDKFCPNALVLNNTLKALKESKEYDELYLHFSGHGHAEGIPFEEWKLHNTLFANILEDKKIKFCFFSSCQSADLVKIVSEREIPIVLGTKYLENIENTYAIDFQLEFYRGLANKLSFLQAFKNAYTTQKVKEREENPDPDSGVVVKHRGEGSWEDIEAGNKKLNELQIVFSEKEYQDRYLINPTVVEKVMNGANTDTFLFFTSDDNRVREEFKKMFFEKGYHDLYTLCLLGEKDIQALKNASKATSKNRLIFSRTIKILIWVESWANMKEKTNFRATFDDEEFLHSLKRNRKVQLGLAGRSKEERESLCNDTFNLGKIFNPIIGQEGRWKNRQVIFEQSSLDKLVPSPEWDSLVSEIVIPREVRKYKIMDLPCKTREELYELRNSIAVKERNQILIDLKDDWELLQEDLATYLKEGMNLEEIPDFPQQVLHLQKTLGQLFLELSGEEKLFKPLEENAKDILEELKKGFDELEEILPKICVFFTTKIYENLVNYLINGIILFQESKTPFPVYVSDCTLNDNGTPLGALRDNIVRRRNSPNIEDIDDSDIRIYLPFIIKNGCIILFRLDKPDKKSFQEEVSSILQVFEDLPSYTVKGIGNPSYIFFINKTDVSCPDKLFCRSKSKSFSTPNPILDSDIDTWSADLINKDSWKKLVNKVKTNIPFQQLAAYCPSLVIGKISYHLEIPPNQIINLPHS